MSDWFPVKSKVGMCNVAVPIQSVNSIDGVVREVNARVLGRGLQQTDRNNTVAIFEIQYKAWVINFDALIGKKSHNNIEIETNLRLHKKCLHGIRWI